MEFYVITLYVYIYLVWNKVVKDNLSSHICVENYIKKLQTQLFVKASYMSAFLHLLKFACLQEVIKGEKKSIEERIS